MAFPPVPNSRAITRRMLEDACCLSLPDRHATIGDNSASLCSTFTLARLVVNVVFCSRFLSSTGPVPFNFSGHPANQRLHTHFTPWPAHLLILSPLDFSPPLDHLGSGPPPLTYSTFFGRSHSYARHRLSLFLGPNHTSLVCDTIKMCCI